METNTQAVDPTLEGNEQAQVPTAVEIKINDDDKLKQAIPTFDVVRNGVKARVFAHLIKGKVKRAFPGVDLEKLGETKEEALANAAKFVGVDTLLRWANQKYRKACLDWTSQTIESVGRYDSATFIDFMIAGKITRNTSEELRDQLTVILTKLKGLPKNDVSEETQVIRASMLEEMASILQDLESRKKGGKKGEEASEGSKADTAYEGDQGVAVTEDPASN